VVGLRYRGGGNAVIPRLSRAPEQVSHIKLASAYVKLVVTDVTRKDNVQKPTNMQGLENNLPEKMKNRKPPCDDMKGGEAPTAAV
jgi:hypothetical protein